MPIDDYWNVPPDDPEYDELGSGDECARCQCLFESGTGYATDYCCYECYEEDMVDA